MSCSLHLSHDPAAILFHLSSYVPGRLLNSIFKSIVHTLELKQRTHENKEQVSLFIIVFMLPPWSCTSRLPPLAFPFNFLCAVCVLPSILQGSSVRPSRRSGYVSPAPQAISKDLVIIYSRGSTWGDLFRDPPLFPPRAQRL